jgi:hypothetical protein
VDELSERVKSLAMGEANEGALSRKNHAGKPSMPVAVSFSESRRVKILYSEMLASLLVMGKHVNLGVGTT